MASKRSRGFRREVRAWRPPYLAASRQSLGGVVRSYSPGSAQGMVFSRRLCILVIVAVTAFFIAEVEESFSAEGFVFNDHIAETVSLANDDGTNVRAISPNNGYEEQALSPDGSTVVFSRGDEIVAIDSTGANQRVIFKGPDSDNPPNGRRDYAAWPAFSPDGLKVIFTYFPNYPFSDLTNGDIWEVNLDGTGAHALVTTSGNQVSPRFSPDGARIAYTSTCDGCSQPRIWTAASSGQGPANLTAGSNPVFSPGGTRIAFSCAGLTSGLAGICTMNTDGSGRTLYAGGTPNDRFFNPHTVDWSPDGDTFLVSANYWDPESTSGENGAWLYTIPANSPVPLSFTTSSQRLFNGWVGRYRQPAIDYTAAYQSLLSRYSPYLKYDSQELFFADSAGELTDNYLSPGGLDETNKLITSAGRTLATANPSLGFATLSLGFLNATYPTGDLALPADRLDARNDSDDDYQADAQRMHADPIYADRVYGRATRDSQGRIWLQYWFFYYYNPQNAGITNTGVHEGDWEMVQLRLNDASSPDVVTYARHADEQEGCGWWQVEKWQAPDGSLAPVVYVANGSHASYFRAGDYPRKLGVAPNDDADGLGYETRPRLELLKPIPGAPWSWPGHWGNSVAEPVIFEGSSPRGPAFQGERWEFPNLFHSSAKQCTDLGNSASSGSESPPIMLTAQESGAAASITYSIDDRGLASSQKPMSVFITVHSAYERYAPSGRSVRLKDDRRGTVRIPLPLGPRPYTARASTYTGNGSPTPVVSTDVK